MSQKVLLVLSMLSVSTGPLLADFSYHETSKITGGVMAGVLKVAGVFSKQAREPIEATVAFKGNKMVHRGAMQASIIDLDARTITSIDLQKKQYSVMTFDEMKQAMEQLSEKTKQNKDADMSFKVSADATGKRKQIAGYDAKELLMKIQMQATDKKSGQNGSMVVMTDLWIAENVPGYSEAAEFYKKMAAEMNWTPGGNMFAAQPEIAKGMAEAFKEVSKMNGTPVFQKMVMGPEGIAPPSDEPAPQQEAKPKPSAGSVLGGALGGRFGLGKKKNDQAQQPSDQPQQQGGGALIEMQTEYSGFAPTADAALFEIPAGLKKVESDIKKMR
jgi:hypothetical protein